MRWWARLLHRQRVERELDAELRYDFERRVDDFIAAGMSARDARRAATLEFGGIDQIKELCRDARGTRWFEDAVDDIRYALRLLRKDRPFAAVAISALALGIAVNNTQFAIVDAYCLRGLPIDRADRVASVGTRDLRRGAGGMSYADFNDISRAVTAFTGMAAAGAVPVALGDTNQGAESAMAAFVSVTALGVLGRAPALGRDFRPDDSRPGAPIAILLSDRVWRSRYNGDPAILGRAVRINGSAGAVVGVMPHGFTFPGHADVWIPLEQMPGVRTSRRDARTLTAFGRLHDRLSLAQAQAELDAIGARLAIEYPDTNADITPAAESINAHYNGDITNPAWLAFTIVGALVVLIACANVANLMLMRSAVRAREVAMRTALGATRARVVRQLLVEGAVLAMAAGVLGLALSAAGLRVFVHAIPETAIPYGGFSFNARVLGVLAVVTMGTVFVFGLVPALSASRTDVSGALKTGGLSVTHDRRVRRWTTGFLTVEFALTVLLVSAVGLSVESFRAARGASERIERARLLTLRLVPSAERYATAAQREALYDQLRSRLMTTGGVASVSFATYLPLGGATPMQFEREGDVRSPGEKRPVVWTLAIDPAYFSTLGLSMIRGRPFDDDSAHDGRVIVNERLARLFFADADPIGRRIRLASTVRDLPSARWLTIAGVAPDIRQNPPIAPDAMAYLPFAATHPTRAALIVKAAGDPAPLVPLVREQIRTIDPDLPVIGLQTLQQAEREAGWNGRVSQDIIMTIASIALLLAAVGLYAVTAYGVAQRTREIAIRVVLGAVRRRVIWLVLRGALLQVAIGVVAGFALQTVWASFFGGPRGAGPDPFNLTSAIAILTVVALGASIAPVLRALRVDPL
ncbi:MAG TPA: ABC transporter permease, partial [Vicinamibacterales bacterium]